MTFHRRGKALFVIIIPVIAALVILVIGEIRLILEEKQTIIALGVCVRHKITDQGMAVMESEKEPGINL